MSNANKEIVRRKKFEEMIGNGNSAVVDELVDEDVVSYDPSEPEPVRGRDAYRAGVEMYLNAFSGLRTRIDDQVAEGDKVVTRWTITGRHEGDLSGIPPTGKDVEFTGIDIHRLKDGRIVEEWTHWDTLGLMRQLGVVPEVAS